MFDYMWMVGEWLVDVKHEPRLSGSFSREVGSSDTCGSWKWDFQKENMRTTVKISEDQFSRGRKWLKMMKTIEFPAKKR